jgi:hypothetical protein
MEGLYPSILGEEWENLASPIRDFHRTQAQIRAEGIFRIVRGPGWLGRLFAWVAHFPRSGEQVKTQLRVEFNEEEETWRRVFDGKDFVSVQQIRKGILWERWGPFEIEIRLRSEIQRLFYFSERACFILGPLRIKIPRWVGIQVKGSESVLPEGERLFIEMEMGSKISGKILSYGGEIHWWREK